MFLLKLLFHKFSNFISRNYGSFHVRTRDNSNRLIDLINLDSCDITHELALNHALQIVRYSNRDKT